MVVGLVGLQLAIIFGNKFLYVLCSLIVHDVQFWLKSLLLQFFEVCLVCIEDADVV